jgi:hypothetical protein
MVDPAMSTDFSVNGNAAETLLSGAPDMVIEDADVVDNWYNATSPASPWEDCPSYGHILLKP